MNSEFSNFQIPGVRHYGIGAETIVEPRGGDVLFESLSEHVANNFNQENHSRRNDQGSVLEESEAASSVPASSSPNRSSTQKSSTPESSSLIPPKSNIQSSRDSISGM